MSTKQKILAIVLASPVFLLLLGFVTLRFIYKPYHMSQKSMEPTILTGDRVIADTAAYADSGPQRGDLLAFRSPRNESVTYIKRVVALGGERVAVRESLVLINDEPLTATEISDRTPLEGMADNPAIKELLRESSGQRSWYVLRNREEHRMFTKDWPRQGEYTVPSGHVFVLGDNRDNSTDSRQWGSIPPRLMVGRIDRIAWSRHPDGGLRTARFLQPLP